MKIKIKKVKLKLKIQHNYFRNIKKICKIILVKAIVFNLINIATQIIKK